MLESSTGLPPPNAILSSLRSPTSFSQAHPRPPQRPNNPFSLSFSRHPLLPHPQPTPRVPGISLACWQKRWGGMASHVSNKSCRSFTSLSRLLTLPAMPIPRSVVGPGCQDEECGRRGQPWNCIGAFGFGLVVDFVFVFGFGFDFVSNFVFDFGFGLFPRSCSILFSIPLPCSNSVSKSIVC